MARFFFNNEALPPTNSIQEFSSLFQNTLLEFKKLSDDKKLDIQRGIVTENPPSQIVLDDYTLKDVLESFENSDIRKLAFSYFTKFPFEPTFQIEDEELVLQMDSYIKIDEKEYPATYLSVVSLLDEYAFTVATHNELKNNKIELKRRDKEEEVLYLNNLYGQSENTAFASSHIHTKQIEKLGLFEQMLSLLKSPVYNDSFEKSFLQFSLEEQESIVELFQRAIDRNLQTPFTPDDKIVKDVSGSSRARKCLVYELRIRSPRELRLYFNEGEEHTYLGRIEKKSNANQNNDIKKAEINIYKLIQTN